MQSTPEARSRIYGANFRLPGFAPRGFFDASGMADDYNAISSHAVAEGPFRDWVLLVSCSLGLLAGLGIFGFVCYLLVH